MIFLQNFLISESMIKNFDKIVNKWKMIYLYENNKLKITHP